MDKEVNYWEKLKSLPSSIRKTEGYHPGIYSFTLTFTDGVYFIEYILLDSFSTGDFCFPNMHFSGDTLEELVDKAADFFKKNNGEFEYVK